ncbi:MAG: hypothetical protein ACR2GA_04965 [Chloroflexota bacterium]
MYRPIASAALVLVIALIGAVFLSGAIFSSHGRAASVPPTVDPRLILHPHTVTAHAYAGRHASLTLRLYPAIPGKQQIQLTFSPARRAPVLTLRATMVGMSMPAIRAHIRRHGATYHGTMALPMFGEYSIAVSAPGRPPMTVRVVLPLPNV